MHNQHAACSELCHSPLPFHVPTSHEMAFGGRKPCTEGATLRGTTEGALFKFSWSRVRCSSELVLLVLPVLDNVASC